MGAFIVLWPQFLGKQDGHVTGGIRKLKYVILIPHYSTTLCTFIKIIYSGTSDAKVSAVELMMIDSTTPY